MEVTDQVHVPAALPSAKEKEGWAESKISVKPLRNVEICAKVSRHT